MTAFFYALSWLSATEIRRYSGAVAVNTSTVIAQVALIALSGGSLTLLSDTIHLLSDNIAAIGSLSVAILATMVTREKENLIRRAFAIGGVLLLFSGAYHILGESVERMANPVNIASGWVLAGGVVGIFGSAVVYAVLHWSDPEKNSTHVVFSWHTIFDFLFSAIVVLSASGALAFGIQGIDAWMSHKLSLFMFVLSGFLLGTILKGHHHEH
ncbi:MAG: cation transporter [Patescibacteria group bacterium]